MTVFLTHKKRRLRDQIAAILTLKWDRFGVEKRFEKQTKSMP